MNNLFSNDISNLYNNKKNNNNILVKENEEEDIETKNETIWNQYLQQKYLQGEILKIKVSLFIIYYIYKKIII